MEIEYKRELTKSYMCVKTDQDFLPFEKEILTRSSILGIVPVNTIFADAATVCWYDITGMQAFDHALEMEMMDSQMLTQFLVSLCGTLERLEGFLLDQIQVISGFPRKVFLKTTGMEVSGSAIARKGRRILQRDFKNSWNIFSQKSIIKISGR